MHVLVCASVCRGALSCTAVCGCCFLRAESTEVSRHLSLRGSALPLPESVTLNDPRGKNSHGSPSCESRARDPETVALDQVALRTCVRCLRASLSEGVTLRKLPVHRHWLESLLVSCPSTGACSKTSCPSTSACYNTSCVQRMTECKLPVHRPLHARSLSTVLPVLLHGWSHVCCTHGAS